MHSNGLAEWASELKSELGRLQAAIVDMRDLLLNQKTVKESYDTKEVAEILDRKPYTVREWCRLKRVNAFKAMCGRGCEEEWRITHQELVRIQNEGLLRVPERY